jgi:hypothetical protein
LFTFRSFLEKNSKVAQFLGYFFDGSSKALIFYKKMGLATFWAIFSQNRLVNLNGILLSYIVFRLNAERRNAERRNAEFGINHTMPNDRMPNTECRIWLVRLC